MYTPLPFQYLEEESTQGAGRGLPVSGPQAHRLHFNTQSFLYIPQFRLVSPLFYI